MKTLATITCSFFFLMISVICSSQASVISNSGSSTDFIGWDNSNNFDLRIGHEGNQNVIFRTNGNYAGAIQNDGRVLLGTFTASPAALTVRSTLSMTSFNQAVFSFVEVIGASSSALVGGFFDGEGTNNTNNAGIYGVATNSATTVGNYGAAGYTCNTGFTNSTAISVYGNAECQGTSFAAYMNGKTFCTGGIWSGSDENLKTNIQDLDNGLSIIQSLDPKSYEFLSNDYLNLSSDQQYGLLAQDVEVQVPTIVTEVREYNIGLEENSTGSLIHAVNYSQLIPVLVSAFQERQSQIEQQHQIISDLTSAIEQAENALDLLSE